MKQLNDKMVSYLSVIGDILQKLDVERFNVISENIEKMSELIKSIEDYTSTDSSDPEAFLESYLKLYELFAAFEHVSNWSIRLLIPDQYITAITHNMSQTFATGIYRQRGELTDLAEKIHNSAMKNDPAIFDWIASKLSLTKSAKNYELVMGMLEKIKSSSSLVVSLTQRLLEIARTDEDKQRLLDRVEYFKSDVLSVPTLEFSREYATAQRMLVRYGLAPISDSMPLPDIAKEIGGKTVTGSAKDSFAALASNISPDGLLVIISLGRNPIEFNLLPLISAEYLEGKDLLGDPAAGVNKKTIRRYNTVHALTPPTEQRYDNFYDFIGTSRRTYIIETLNGCQYRLLSDISAGRTVSSRKARALVAEPSMRAFAYNDILGGIIVDAMINKRAGPMVADYENEKKSPPATTIIKSAIKRRLAEQFVAEHMKTLPSSDAELTQRAISRDYINGVLSEQLIKHEIEAHGDEPPIEYKMTFVRKLNNIIASFHREFLRTASAIKIPPMVFKEKKKEELKSYLLGAYNDAVSEAVEELDKAPSLWQGLDISLKEYAIEHRLIL